MAAFPILSRFQYDCHIKVVEIAPELTMDEVAAACAEHSIDLHVAPRPDKVLRVRPTTETNDAPPWPREMTAEAAGIAYFDSIDIYFDEYFDEPAE